MSAEVLGSLSPVEPLTRGPARPAPAALLEPSLVTRLLGVATAVFAVPVLIALRAAFAGSGAPSDASLAGAFVAAALLAAGFGGLLRAAPRAPELRAGRALLAVLGVEVAAMAAALLSRIV